MYDVEERGLSMHDTKAKKVAIVTGGGRGLGRAMALGLRA